MKGFWLNFDYSFPVAPVPIYEPLDKFGYQIGKLGLINISFEANPKPHVEWQIGGESITEGYTDKTGRIEAETARDLVSSFFLLVNL